MLIIERVVAILRPTEKMLNWIKNLPDAPDAVTIKNLQHDCTAFLLPAFDSPRQADAYLKDICHDVLEGELISWGIPRALWPEVLDHTLFLAWFTPEYHSVLFDTLSLDSHKKKLEIHETQTDPS